MCSAPIEKSEGCNHMCCKKVGSINIPHINNITNVSLPPPPHQRTCKGVIETDLSVQA